MVIETRDGLENSKEVKNFKRKNEHRIHGISSVVF